jgi:hypothetical protein
MKVCHFSLSRPRERRKLTAKGEKKKEEEEEEL